MSGKLTITCAEFRPLRRNTLVGFAVVDIAELKFRIHDLALHQKGEARWAQLPAKPQVRDGNLVKDPSGKVQYWPVFEIENRAVRDAFSAAVVAAVLKHTPHAFDGSA
jgi:hypothetical protein